MQWETQIIADPTVKYVIEHGPLYLSITPGEDHTWQHVIVSLGESSTKSPDDCQQSWERRAIGLVRNALDAFEATLGE